MRKVTIVGGPLKGAQYGDLQESEIAKASKAYRGDPRFLQYCRLYMASKVLDVTDEPLEKSEDRFIAAKLRHFATRISPIFSQCFKSDRRYHVFFGCLFFLLLLSRPSFSILCGKVSILVIKTFIKKSIALVTMILDAVLEEAVNQVDSTFLPPPAVQMNTLPGHAIVERGTELYQLFLHLGCLIFGALLGRQYVPAPRV